MEDLKQIQEFFSKPLEEGKQLDQVDFAKVVKAVEQTGHPVTVLLVPKFNEIEVLTGMNAPDDMLFDLSNAVDSLGYGRDDIIIAADSSNLSRREYSDIRRVNGGAKDYFEESVSEYNSGIYYTPDTKEKTKDAAKTGIEKVKDMIQKVLKEEEGEDPIDTITMDVPLFIRVLEYAKEDAETDMDLHDLAEKAIAATKQQGMLSMDDYDMLVGELKQIGMEEAEEEGYSKYLKTDDNPEGKTKGLDTKTMNKILMNVIKDLDESRPGLWDNIRAKKAKGEKPSHGNSKAHKDAVKAGKRINKEK